MAEVGKWEGRTKIGDKAFEGRFYEVVYLAGFRTHLSKNAKLFAGTDQERPRPPRFLVGVKLLDLSVDLRHSETEHYGAGAIVGRTRMQLEWQVKDNTVGRTVLTVVTGGVSPMSLS